MHDFKCKISKFWRPLCGLVFVHQAANSAPGRGPTIRGPALRGPPWFKFLATPLIVFGHKKYNMKENKKKIKIKIFCNIKLGNKIG